MKYRRPCLHGPTDISLSASAARQATFALLARWSFRRTLRLRPTHPETLHNLGEFLEKQGDSARAVLSFGRAVKVAAA